MNVVTNELARFAEDELGIASAEAIVTTEGGDLRAIATALAAVASLDTATVLRRFGRRLFHRFAALYPAFVGAESSFDLLRELGPRIHGGLQDLYPEAAFPRLQCDDAAPGELVVTYRSERGLADLAEGLLAGCVEYFDEDTTIERATPAPETADVRFVLRRR
jgi:hypothetical protein